jgi:threonylcarbamoyladenosine tRNA methylthiotransferase MtaB
VRILVTGCYAQRAPEALASLPGVAGVFGNREKVRVAEMAAAGGGSRGPLIEVGGFGRQEPFQACEVSRFPGHTRAWLKIQEGCSHACSYCIVPLVRGPARSLPLDRVLSSLESLAGEGFQEIVLTGVDLGQYGRDLPFPTTLAGLAPRLAQKAWPFRVRLSSLEPQGITAELMEALAGLPHLCPHFHLPLQSGSAQVLQAMGRSYSPEDFRELVMELHRHFPGAALGLDILVGFPGNARRTSRPPGAWWRPCRWRTCMSSPFLRGPAPRPSPGRPSPAAKFGAGPRSCGNWGGRNTRPFAGPT